MCAAPDDSTQNGNGDDDSDTRPRPEGVTDGAGIGKAHGRYGTYLREAGLPFEPEEFEEEDPGAAQDMAEDAVEEE